MVDVSGMLRTCGCFSVSMHLFVKKWSQTKPIKLKRNDMSRNSVTTFSFLLGMKWMFLNGVSALVTNVIDNLVQFALSNYLA